MKALTLYQPFASLVALGLKQVETRSWRTSYRGPLAELGLGIDPLGPILGHFTLLTLWSP